MKKEPLKSALAALGAGLLVVVGATTTATGATPLQGQISIRPLTPTEQATYKLSSLQKSGGLGTVALGEPVYLDALVNIAIPPGDIIGVTWALTNQPAGSLAAITNSPLGTNVPVYKPSDALVSQVAGRAAFWPDVRGQYTLTATITTASEGTTNLVQTITAGVYMGIETCSLCHSGGEIAMDKVTPWSQTEHATMFTRGIDGQVSSSYSVSCIPCHTVGYDADPRAANNGNFCAVAKKLGWTFPTVLTNSNWTSLTNNYPSLANVANIQCESCHGPGSEHASAMIGYAPGATNFDYHISKVLDEGDCAQCHDDMPHHSIAAEWNNSVHAVTTTDPAGSASCVGCHTAYGFVARMEGTPIVNTAYEAITCSACHEPHDVSKPDQVRAYNTATLMDGTVVTNAGLGGLCMQCHQSRENATNYLATATGSSHFGPHHGPQADMLEGVNGYTYGKPIGSSPHKDCVPDTCVTCHMQTDSSTSPAFTRAGGHTFEPACSASGTNPAVQLTAVCVQCHGSITTFNFPTVDYDGDGVVEGVQTEVANLMLQLATLLPPVGVAKTNLTIDSTWTPQQLKAAYNYLFVQSDGSYGVHNIAYTVDLLKGSIADLGGGPTSGGLPASWQIEYFGSTTNPNAAPNASPAGDGIPNWLKYALGLNPTVAGITLPGGVVWANGSTEVSAGNTNSIAIYTAAEVAFTTEVGKTYQLQGISSLGAGWQNIGSPITGTGSSMSFLTPTRNDPHQFFRVVSQ
jgi:hypothetical protein